MLKLIEGSYASFFPREINAMFRNRAETFAERLGWEVAVKDGYERDMFDDANPLYLVSVDPDTEEYWGSLRLLPTTGPNMLRDVFPQLLDGDTVESATIWESSRICTAGARGRLEQNKNINAYPERAHFGHRRSRGGCWTDADRLGFRRQDFPRPESRRMQSPDYRNAATDRSRHVLRGSFRHRRGTAGSLSRRDRHCALRSRAGRQGNRFRLTGRPGRPVLKARETGSAGTPVPLATGKS